MSSDLSRKLNDSKNLSSTFLLSHCYEGSYRRYHNPVSSRGGHTSETYGTQGENHVRTYPTPGVDHLGTCGTATRDYVEADRAGDPSQTVSQKALLCLFVRHLLLLPLLPPLQLPLLLRCSRRHSHVLSLAAADHCDGGVVPRGTPSPHAPPAVKSGGRRDPCPRGTRNVGTSEGGGKRCWRREEAGRCKVTAAPMTSLMRIPR